MAIEVSRMDHQEIMEGLKEEFPNLSEPALRVKASLMQMIKIRKELEKIL